MSHFEEIKGLFTNEIFNSPQYQVALKIKDLIKQDIITPNINFTFLYELQDTDYIDIKNKDKEANIIGMALKMILGIEVDIYMSKITVVMNKFI
jgi:hypothetical protein